MTRLQTKMQSIDCFHLAIFISESARKLMRKKSKEDEKTLEELNAARRSQAKCQLVQTSYITQIKLFLCMPYNKHLIDRAKSVCMRES